MANKLFKHFGFSSKKVSSQSSPSHEYSSSGSSGSIQDVRSKSPTKSRYGTSIVSPGASPGSSGPVRSDFEGRRHSDAATVRGSLSRGRNRSTPPSAAGGPELALSRGARSKDQQQRFASFRGPAPAGGSGDSSSALPVRSATITGRRHQPVEIDGSIGSPSHCIDNTRSPPQLLLPSPPDPANGLSPKILDEYSDPFDLKKLNSEQSDFNDAASIPAVSAAASTLSDTADATDQLIISEDDYSVPYEVKTHALDGSMPVEVTPREPNSVPKYDDPYAEGPVSVSLNAVSKESTTDFATSNIMAGTATDGFKMQTSDLKSDGIVNNTRTLDCTNKVSPVFVSGDSADNANHQTFMEDVDCGATYDEPWDLRAARLGLESRLRAVHSSPDQLASLSSHSELISRQPDPRPAIEYDEPWDRRVREVHRNLISAKAAKEEARGHRAGGGMFCAHMLSSSCHQTHHAVEGSRPSLQHLHSTDLKSMSAGPRTGTQTARHKCGPELRDGQSTCQPVAERIDPRVPLEQQGWYHGSISRVDAESLLRVHREGSYLVRMSESNRVDYSLSFKSARGFMHMKIVGTNSPGTGSDSDGVGVHYILGQFSQPFDSIPQMIHHYTINKLPIKGAEHMSLLHPVNNELL